MFLDIMLKLTKADMFMHDFKSAEKDKSQEGTRQTTFGTVQTLHSTPHSVIAISCLTVDLHQNSLLETKLKGKEISPQ